MSILGERGVDERVQAGVDASGGHWGNEGGEKGVNEETKSEGGERDREREDGFWGLGCCFETFLISAP